MITSYAQEKKRIGTNLRKLLKERQMTHKELAIMLGVRIENLLEQIKDLVYSETHEGYEAYIREKENGQ